MVLMIADKSFAPYSCEYALFCCSFHNAIPKTPMKGAN